MDQMATGQVLPWIVRGLYAGSALAYLGHLWLVWRRVRAARALMMGVRPRPARRRVTVEAHVLQHGGEVFLLRDLLPAPNEE